MTRRSLALAAVAAVGVVGMAAWSSSRGTGTSPVAQAQATSTPLAPPVERAPYDRQAVARTVTAMQDHLRYDPQSGVGYGNLADALLALQRESGDIAYAVRAEQAARLSLHYFPANASALRSLSRSLLAQHRFGEALLALKRARADDADALRLKVDLFIELGDYASAQRALDLSPPVGQDANYYSLRSRLLEVHGQPERALADVRTARAQAEANLDASPESVAWYYGREARVLASMGRDEQAVPLLLRAIAIFPRDYRAMNFLAHLKANGGDWKGAAQWASRAASIVPEPDTVALLGDAYAALGRPREAQGQFALVEAIARLARARGVIYDRQRALFYASHDRNLDQALALARGEVKLRRDIYTFDTLAWAAYKKKLLPEASQAAARALAYNTQDAMLWYHAGLIAAASGQKAQASRDLSRALAINPRFHPSAPAQARAVLSRLASSARP